VGNRYALNAEKLAQRKAKPPKLGSPQPGGGKSTFMWARELFEDLGNRTVPATTITEASDIVTEGIAHLQVTYQTPSVGGNPTEQEDVEMTAGLVPSQAAPVDAGLAAFGPTPDATVGPAPSGPHPRAPGVAAPTTPQPDATRPAEQQEIRDLIAAGQQSMSDAIAQAAEHARATLLNTQFPQGDLTPRKEADDCATQDREKHYLQVS
jgi:hypothetical protein